MPRLEKWRPMKIQIGEIADWIYLVARSTRMIAFPTALKSLLEGSFRSLSPTPQR